MKIIKRFVSGVALLLLAGIAALYVNSDIEPQAWQPKANPGLTGVYAPNSALSEVQILHRGQGLGPESIAMGSDGLLYTGYEDGRIVRFDPAPGKQSTPELFVNTGGRPLGMEFDQQGHLIVADSQRGLLSISPIGKLSVLTDQVNGKKMMFVDDLDIAADGTIWFSDASQRFAYHDVIKDFFEASATGRLLTYTPSTGQTEVKLEGLFFANGVTLGPNEDYVLVNESGAAQIRRYWLQGPRQGEDDLFFESLPAIPDNIRFNGRDTFWVALNSLRSDELESLAQQPFVRKLLAGLPAGATPAPEPYGFVVGIDLDGEIVANLQGAQQYYYSVTSVTEFDGMLYLGSWQNDALGLIPVPEKALSPM